MADYNFSTSGRVPCDKLIEDIKSSPFSKKSGDEVFVELAKECDNLMSELVSSTPMHHVGGNKRCRSAKRCVRFGSCGDEPSISCQNKSKRETSYSTVSSPQSEEENFRSSIDRGDDFSNIVADIDYQNVLSSTVQSGLVTQDIIKECSSYRSTGIKSKQPGCRLLNLPVGSAAQTANLRQSSAVHQHLQQSSKLQRGCGDGSISPPLDLILQQATKGGTTTGRASPLSGLGDILDWLRPRAFSDHIKNRRRSSGADTAISSMSSSGGNGHVPSSYRQQHRLSLSNSRHKSSNGSNSQTTNSSTVRSPFHQTTRCSGDEGFASSEDVNKPLYVDTTMANDWINALPPPLHEYCARRSMSISSDPFVLSKKLAAAGNAALSRQRQRRNSEFGRYFIMRKSMETGGMNEFVAQLEDNGEQAYCQLLCSMKCYDVMPTMSTVVVLDSTLPVSKGCAALVRNEVGAAIILESTRSSILGILTVTDLLNTITNLRSISDPNEILNAPIFLQQQMQQKDDDNSTDNSISSSNRSSDVERDEKDIGIMTIKPVYVFSDNNLYVVSKLLCERRLHRVVVYDSELNVDPLFLLSKRMILKALHKYIARLPLPACMHLSLDELRLGTWNNLLTVFPETKISECLEKMILGKISCLPVVRKIIVTTATPPLLAESCCSAASSPPPSPQNEKFVLLNVLTKHDILNLIVDEYGAAKCDVKDFLEKKAGDVLTCKSQHGPGKLFTCHKRITLMLAVESMLHADAHRLIVVDSLGYLEAIVSVSDLMRFLIAS